MSHSTLGLLVLVNCLRSPTSQQGSIGLLLQPDDLRYFRCPPPGSRVAAKTSTADLTTTQLRAATSTIEVENMAHSESMSPASLGIRKKLSRRCKLKTPPDGGLHQTFPTDPHDTLGPTRSFQLPPPPVDPTHHLVIS
ncbi:hypothetical protein NQD34_015952 [Periophthalmus magnuspinnatus]|nr:hypothetical protein NQD34_015952 [Periophthalmus magnuspinnatus]